MCLSLNALITMNYLPMMMQHSHHLCSAYSIHTSHRPHATQTPRHTNTTPHKHHATQTPHQPQGTEEEKQAAKQHLIAVLEAVRIVAVLLSPATPSLSAAIYAQLGFPEDAFAGLQWDRDTQWGALCEGQEVPKPSPVFVRLEGDFVTEVAAKNKQPVAAGKA